jgi:hypothetical protein
MSVSDLLFGDVNERRRACKILFSRIPCRPLVKFSFLYFIKFGFLDGKAGLYYSAMQAFYEFMISVKLLETRQTGRSATALKSLEKAA